MKVTVERMMQLEEKLECLETKFRELQSPPKFEAGYQVLHISPCGDVGVGFIDAWKKPYLTSSGWVYWVIDKNGKHIDNWGENEMVSMDHIRRNLLCKEE